ncbi:hypothetical protein AXG93_2782s1090 [Marchantia polymorpha subsp. ruderalis]|uniref:Uncharacterized protein n=1 Tax=Marchantia polymorpha subsp. ruderalis TaxID=1480154 RepID=A0A176WSN1_MARPO|nr:hypothetical protein AXG93_2782s1090 [Marchantia polymorpha subsp. ruderalis]
MNDSNSSSPSARNGEEQPLFKKPRLDVSLVIPPEFQCDDGSVILRNCVRMTLKDGKGPSSCLRAWASAVRVVTRGFRLSSFAAPSAPSAFSIPPRTTTPGGSRQAAPSPSPAGKRDSHNGATWGAERRTAVDCLLGAALRLPSAGLRNMEDLLPQGSRGSAKGSSRSPSFDTVEKAKRSGPSCDSAVKAFTKRSSSASPSPSVSASASPAVGADAGEKAPAVGACHHHADEKPVVSKRPHAPPNPAGHHMKPSSTGAGAARKHEGERGPSPTLGARKSPSVGGHVSKTRKSPGIGDYDDKSETTVDNSIQMNSSRRSPGGCANAVVAMAVKSEGGEPGDARGKDESSRGSGCGDRSKAAVGGQDSGRREGSGNGLKRAHADVAGGSMRGAAASAAARGDRKSPICSESSAGESDCSNVTEVQRSDGHGSSSRDVSLRKSQSFKSNAQARPVRPNLIIGKSGAIDTSKTPKKVVDLKDPKLRRSSNSPRVTGDRNVNIKMFDSTRIVIVSFA